MARLTDDALREIVARELARAGNDWEKGATNANRALVRAGVEQAIEALREEARTNVDTHQEVRCNSSADFLEAELKAGKLG